MILFGPFVISIGVCSHISHLKVTYMIEPHCHLVSNHLLSLLILHYLGQPKRHLLTTGWSLFVSGKRLFAGDAVLFIR